jgi:hypothetical protein
MSFFLRQKALSSPILWCAALFAVAAAYPIVAAATFHTYRVEQVFSNADGTIQFIVLHESQHSDGEHLFSGHDLTVSTNTGVAPHIFTFPHDLPSSATADTRVLIGTEGFAALNQITPDYIVPNNFVFPGTGTVNFADVDSVTYHLPTDGVNAVGRAGTPIPNLATNFAGQSVSITVSAPAPKNYQGLWWASPATSEAGWGMNLTHQGDIIFATWFTYDTAGKGWWLVMTANKTANDVFSGTLYQTTGPAFSAVPFDPTHVTPTSVGTGTLTFSGDHDATFAYVVNGTSQTKAITREVFGPLPVCAFAAQGTLAQATNYQDLWWHAPANSEGGWGINFTHQGDTIFATWFTYGTDGKPMWLVVTAAKTAAKTYSGVLYRTTGPAFDSVPFDPNKVKATAAGNATLTFADGNTATFAYTVDGISQTKSITRELFSSPSTTCQ